MSRPQKAFVWILAAQTLLCGSIAAVDVFGGCSGCRNGISLALAGFLFYAGLLLQVARQGVGPFAAGAALFAFGLHLGLTVDRLKEGLPCLPCFAAAAGSTVLAVVGCCCDRGSLARAPLLLPGAALAMTLWSSPPHALAEPAGPAVPGAVRVTVFTQADCPYCDELRDRVLPEILKDFGPRIEVAWRPASELPAVRRTPTIVIARGVKERPSRVLEGLPTAEALRVAIRAVEGKP